MKKILNVQFVQFTIRLFVNDIYALSFLQNVTFDFDNGSCVLSYGVSKIFVMKIGKGRIVWK